MCIISMYMDQDMEGRGIFDHLEIVTTFYNKHYHTKVKKKSNHTLKFYWPSFLINWKEKDIGFHLGLFDTECF